MMIMMMMMMVMMIMMAIAEFELFRGHFLKESVRHFTLFLNLKRSVH